MPVAYVLFDADNKILKNVTFKKSYNMLKAQVISAENFLDRYGDNLSGFVKLIQRIGGNFFKLHRNAIAQKI